MIRLIVNADDLGSGPQRDRGIFETFTEGIVTSASLLANGPTFASAIVTIEKTGLPFGIHLNLSEGRPLTGPIPGLTDREGLLFGKARSREVFPTGQFDLQQVRLELAAQIERVLESGLQPDHLDTHQHFYLYADLATLVLDLAEKYRIDAVRLPVPAEPDDFSAKGRLREELTFYRQCAPLITSLTRASRCFAPDGLWGMPVLNRLEKDTLLSLIEQIPHGTWELMVHPGYPDQASGFSSRERDLERAALISPDVRERLLERGVQLISYGEGRCAS